MRTHLKSESRLLHENGIRMNLSCNIDSNNSSYIIISNCYYMTDLIVFNTYDSNHENRKMHSLPFTPHSFNSQLSKIGIQRKTTI